MMVLQFLPFLSQTVAHTGMTRLGGMPSTLATELEMAALAPSVPALNAAQVVPGRGEG